jgi:hypothetical protein
MTVAYETCQANIDCITQLHHQSQIDQQQVSQKIQSQLQQTTTIYNTLSI